MPVSGANPATGDTKGRSYDVDVIHSVAGPTTAVRGWTFLTNHARVLLAIARDPNVRLRDIAEAVGITERAAHTIVADLEASGYLHHTRVGRRNHYTVNPAGRFRHPAEAEQCVGDLLTLFKVSGVAEPPEV